MLRPEQIAELVGRIILSVLSFLVGGTLSLLLIGHLAEIPNTPFPFADSPSLFALGLLFILFGAVTCSIVCMLIVDWIEGRRLSWPDRGDRPDEYRS